MSSKTARKTNAVDRQRWKYEKHGKYEEVPGSLSVNSKEDRKKMASVWVDMVTGHRKFDLLQIPKSVLIRHIKDHYRTLCPCEQCKVRQETIEQEIDRLVSLYFEDFEGKFDEGNDDPLQCNFGRFLLVKNNRLVINEQDAGSQTAMDVLSNISRLSAVRCTSEWLGVEQPSAKKSKPKSTGARCRITAHYKSGTTSCTVISEHVSVCSCSSDDLDEEGVPRPRHGHRPQSPKLSNDLDNCSSFEGDSDEYDDDTDEDGSDVDEEDEEFDDIEYARQQLILCKHMFRTFVAKLLRMKLFQMYDTMVAEKARNELLKEEEAKAARQKTKEPAKKAAKEVGDEKEIEGNAKKPPKETKVDKDQKKSETKKEAAKSKDKKRGGREAGEDEEDDQDQEKSKKKEPKKPASKKASQKQNDSKNLFLEDELAHDDFIPVMGKGASKAGKSQSFSPIGNDFKPTTTTTTSRKETVAQKSISPFEKDSQASNPSPVSASEAVVKQIKAEVLGNANKPKGEAKLSSSSSSVVKEPEVKPTANQSKESKQPTVKPSPKTSSVASEPTETRKEKKPSEDKSKKSTTGAVPSSNGAVPVGAVSVKPAESDEKRHGKQSLESYLKNAAAQANRKANVSSNVAPPTLEDDLCFLSKYGDTAPLSSTSTAAPQATEPAARPQKSAYQPPMNKLSEPAAKPSPSAKAPPQSTPINLSTAAPSLNPIFDMAINEPAKPPAVAKQAAPKPANVKTAAPPKRKAETTAVKTLPSNPGPSAPTHPPSAMPMNPLGAMTEPAFPVQQIVPPNKNEQSREIFAAPLLPPQTPERNISALTHLSSVKAEFGSPSLESKLSQDTVLSYFGAERDSSAMASLDSILSAVFGPSSSSKTSNEAPGVMTDSHIEKTGRPEAPTPPPDFLSGFFRSSPSVASAAAAGGGTFFTDAIFGPNRAVDPAEGEAVTKRGSSLLALASAD